MVFSSLTFLCVFFPMVFIIYYLIPSFRAKNYLLISSLLFYAYGEPVCVLLMIGSSAMNYMYGRLLEKMQRRKLVLTLAVLTNFYIGIF